MKKLVDDGRAQGMREVLRGGARSKDNIAVWRGTLSDGKGHGSSGGRVMGQCGKGGRYGMVQEEVRV